MAVAYCQLCGHHAAINTMVRHITPQAETGWVAVHMACSVPRVEAAPQLAHPPRLCQVLPKRHPRDGLFSAKGHPTVHETTHRSVLELVVNAPQPLCLLLPPSSIDSFRIGFDRGTV